MLRQALTQWLAGLNAEDRARALGALIVRGLNPLQTETGALEQRLIEDATARASFTTRPNFEHHFQRDECLPAAMLARAWAAARPQVRSPVRVHVRLTENDAQNQEVADWLNRCLQDAEAGVDAVSFASSALSERPTHGWDWPIAVGILDGGEGDRLAQRLSQFYWPDLITVGRPSSGAERHDLLLLTGAEDWPRAARRNRTTLLLVDAPFPEAELMHAGHAFRASAVGRALVPLMEGLTRLVEHLSHDEPLDIAWRRAFGPLAPPLWATPSLVEHSHVSAKWQQLTAQLEALAPKRAAVATQEAFVHRGPTGSFRIDAADRAEDAFEADEAQDDYREHEEEPAHDDVAVFEEQLAELANAHFGHETDGASKVARAARVLDNLASQGRLPDRYLQVRLWPTEYQPRHLVLPQDEPVRYVERGQWYLTAVDVTVARTSEHAPRVSVAGLPFEQGRERLQIVLSSPSADIVPVSSLEPTPQRLAATAVGWVDLPRAGDSDIAWFALRPHEGSLEVRVIVAAGNRVLQTALLRGGAASENAPLELRTEAVVRPLLEGANRRRSFDAAIVVNKNTDGVPRMTLIADRRVELEHLDDALAMFDAVSELSAQLTEDPEGDAADPAEALRRRLIDMADVGVTLYRRLVNDTQLREVEAVERLQVISAKPESYLPLEFLYEGESPDSDAQICPNHATGIANRDCGACPHRKSAAHVCPALFWGSTKIIERHAYQQPAPGASTFAVIAAPTAKSSAFPRVRTAIFGHSDKAATTAPGKAALEHVAAYLARMTGTPCTPCADWADWKARVAHQSPTLLALVPHTEKVGASYALEIGTANFLKAGQVRAEIVGSTAPRMALLFGCTTGDARMPFASFPSNFRVAGAEISIATLSPVLGRHAAPALRDLLAHLDEAWASATPKPLAELMLEFRAKQLAKGMPFGWVIVAYGDADWTFGGT
jgi:hypothetical protein